MTNLFTYLSNWKLKYLCTLVVLLCLGVGQMWGATETLTMSEMGWDNASTQSSIPASSARLHWHKTVEVQPLHIILRMDCVYMA